MLPGRPIDCCASEDDRIVAIGQESSLAAGIMDLMFPPHRSYEIPLNTSWT